MFFARESEKKEKESKLTVSAAGTFVFLPKHAVKLGIEGRGRTGLL